MVRAERHEQSAGVEVLVETDESDHFVTQPENDTIATSILLSLSEIDRVAILRFYVERQTAEQVEKTLGLPVGYVEQLKRSVKARYFKERSG